MSKVKVFLTCQDEKLYPFYASEDAAGADVRAAIKEDMILLPQESILVPTGLYVEIPKGYELQVRPRSGLALKHQITVLNSPGTIDSDYRGQIQVILINHGKMPFIIEPKMRIAQLILAPVFQADFIQKEELCPSVRGRGGFGHTGAY